MNLEIIVPIIALIGVLILVLPGFLQTNYNFKVFFKNFIKYEYIKFVG